MGRERTPDPNIIPLPYHDFSQDLGSDRNNCLTIFLKTIFTLYASPDQTINYIGYKDLLRDSGIIPCYEIQDY